LQDEVRHEANGHDQLPRSAGAALALLLQSQSGTTGTELRRAADQHGVAGDDRARAPIALEEIDRA
jgi:hypothetical protein